MNKQERVKKGINNSNRNTSIEENENKSEQD